MLRTILLNILCRVQEVLACYTAQQLFGLSKAVLERMFGADEGGRLYSQLLVQKNLSGVFHSIFAVMYSAYSIFFLLFVCKQVNVDLL